MAESTLWVGHPAMFRNHPIWFVVCVALIVLYGVGLIPLAIWWITVRSKILTITTNRTTYHYGLLSKHTNEVRHSDVGNIRIDQGVLQRMLGVGKISISSAGQADVEIEINGMPNPSKIASLIRKQQG